MSTGPDPTPNIPASDTAEVSRLASLPPLDYGRERENAAKRLGVSLTFLDKAVNGFRGNKVPSETLDDKSLGLHQPEPWTEHVDGADLLSEIVSEIQRYVALEQTNADAVALWVVHTYTFNAFNISPRLAITSPEKGCGKTTLLDVISAVVPKALPTANITAAAVFRTVEAYRPTLLVDEADTFLNKNEELRGILNSGHRKSMAQVVRLVGDGHDTKLFSTWCPVAIAAIGEIPDTLTDRSIRIRLRRRLPGEPITSFRADKVPELSIIARKAARWAVDHANSLADADPTMPNGMINRNADNWAPLLAIADLAGADWPEKARQAALSMTSTGEDGELPASVLLLGDIREIFARRRVDRLPSIHVLTDLNALEDRPWATWSKGSAMNANRLAGLLRRFGIKPANMKTFGRDQVLKGYQREQFEDAWARYL